MNDDDREYELIQEFVRNHATDEILSVVSDKMFAEANSIEAAGYPHAADELRRAADLLFGFYIPGLPIDWNIAAQEMKP